MSANTTFLIAAAASIVGAFAVIGLSIKWGLKWTKIADVSWLKSIGLYFLFTIATIVIFVACAPAIFLFGAQTNETVIGVIAYIIAYVAPSIIIAILYKAPWRRSALATAPYLVISLVAGVFASVVVRKYVYEAFLIPTNSMAPTLLGEHLQAPCPRCGAPAFGPPPPDRFPIPPDGLQMICSKELRSVLVQGIPKESFGGDRLLICKLLTPRHWDMIVFRNPQDPSVNYVMRLVGLPGEKFEIRDGAVWANGQRLEPPQQIHGIRYSPTIENRGQSHSGSGSYPLKLGTDEYFVLGDFADLSFDSRLWNVGAPGHPPYAVPESYIIGVVINVYWPPNRWQSFR